MIVTNVKDSEAPLMRFKRPRLNLSNNNDTGNSVMTESQVKAKLERKIPTSGFNRLFVV